MSKTNKDKLSERLNDLLDKLDEQSSRSSDADFDGEAYADLIEEAKDLKTQLKDAANRRDAQWESDGRNTGKDE
jgi:hypothetical protein